MVKSKQFILEVTKMFKEIATSDFNDVEWYDREVDSELFEDWKQVNRVTQIKKGVLLFTSERKFFLYNGVPSRSILGAIDTGLAIAVKSSSSKLGFSVGLDDMPDGSSWFIEYTDDGFIAASRSLPVVSLQVVPKTSATSTNSQDTSEEPSVLSRTSVKRRG